MKYLVILTEHYEPDNNTPKEKVWAKVVEFENYHEKRQAEDIYLNESVEDGAIDAEVKFIPLDEIDGEWEKIEEVWQ